jgi:hypothetical protein
MKPRKLTRLSVLRLRISNVTAARNECVGMMYQRYCMLLEAYAIDTRLTLWHVMTSVGFAGNVKVIRLSLGESLQKLSNQNVIVRRSLFIVCFIIRCCIRIRKSHSRRLFDIEDISKLVPRVRILRQFPSLSMRKGPCSVPSPNNPEHPGPPFVQKRTGSFAGLPWDSTYQ